MFVPFIFLLFSISFPKSHCEIIRDYNQINHVAYDNLQALINDNFALRNTRASTNVLVGVATPECMHLLNTAAFKGAQRFILCPIRKTLLIHADI
jgi:hypothetical protein